MAMRIAGKIKGVERLKKRLQTVNKNYREAASEAVAEGTLMIHAEAVRLLQENTDGTKQVRYKPKRSVYASDPGDPPNTDRGTAVKSIKFNVKGLIGQVGTNLKYLARFETSKNGKVQRPWLSVAMKNTSRDIAKLFRTKLSKVKP